MAAYMVIRAHINDAARFARYAEAVPALVERFGGRYLALGGAVETLEGAAETRKLVISQWPDMQTARAFWRSADYAEIKRLREGAAEVEVVLVEGREGTAP